MSKVINEDKIRQQFEKAKHKAEELIDDPDQVKSIAARAWEKAKELKEPLAQVWEQLKVMIQMVKAWTHGDYKEVPTTSIIAIVAGLTYLLSPIDLIPDFIPVLGYLDDIFVLGVVFTQVAKDLEAFTQWQARRPEATEPTEPEAATDTAQASPEQPSETVTTDMAEEVKTEEDKESTETTI